MSWENNSSGSYQTSPLPLLKDVQGQPVLPLNTIFKLYKNQNVKWFCGDLIFILCSVTLDSDWWEKPALIGSKLVENFCISVLDVIGAPYAIIHNFEHGIVKAV